MTAGDGRVRLEIAFEGGQSFAATVPATTADALQAALADAQDSVFELETEDARYLISLRRVLYVKRVARETRIGFGGVT